jgi:hypothetical protein
MEEIHFNNMATGHNRFSVVEELGSFLTSYKPVGFSRRTLLLGLSKYVRK